MDKKRIIIDLTYLNDLDWEDKTMEIIGKILNNFTNTFFLIHSGKNKKPVTAQSVSKALFLAFDKEIIFGDSVACFLITKYYFDHFDPISVDKFIISSKSYYSYLTLLKKEKVFNSLKQFPSLDKVKKALTDPNNLQSFLKDNIKMNLTLDETKYVLNHLTTMSFLSSTDDDKEPQRLIYTPELRLTAVIAYFVNYMNDNDKHNTDSVKKDIQQKANERTETKTVDREEAIKSATSTKIW